MEPSYIITAPGKFSNPSSPRLTVIRDNFNRANDTMNRTNTGELWQKLDAGPFDIGIVDESRVGRITTGGSTEFALRGVPTGSADGTHTMRLSFAPGSAGAARGGMAYRIQDSMNFCFVSLRASTDSYVYRLYEMVDGVALPVSGSSSRQPATNDIMAIDFNGPAATLTVNGELVISAAHTRFLSSAKVGVFLGGTSTAKFDDLLFVSRVPE
jgi:hypothetical protein